MTGGAASTLAIAGLGTAGVIVRPFRWPEAVWALAAAAVLVLAGLLPADDAAVAVVRGGDVYAFLAGMMLLAEGARAAGVFHWVAGLAAAHARGRPARLFALTYGAGVVVTMFLSNDATAVVMTPAVLAAARRAEADPLPALFACALVANAASFVLPVSNPANLVLYGGALPPLRAWLAAFGASSAAAILVTYAALRWCQRARLRGRCAAKVAVAPLGRDGRVVLAGLGGTAALLLAASAAGWSLGPPTLAAGAGVALGTALLAGRPPLASVRGVSWDVLLMVAGLFVLVAGVERAGLADVLARAIGRAAAGGAPGQLLPGAVLAVASNLLNNLPAGLLAASAAARAAPPRLVTDGLLIGVDLGPNLSVTGSLATILWLSALRRAGLEVRFGQFLRVGLVAMPPALAAALAVRLAIG